MIPKTLISLFELRITRRSYGVSSISTVLSRSIYQRFTRPLSARVAIRRAGLNGVHDHDLTGHTQ